MSSDKKKIRAAFRDAVFKRDGYQCAILGCTVTENLDAHHIHPRDLMPNGGYVKENGISLCPEHHIEAERFYSEHLYKEGFDPTSLFELIGSSIELAVECSLRLKRPTPEQMSKAFEDPRFGQMIKAFIKGDDKKVQNIISQVEIEAEEDKNRTIQ